MKSITASIVLLIMVSGVSFADESKSENDGKANEDERYLSTQLAAPQFKLTWISPTGDIVKHSWDTKLEWGLRGPDEDGDKAKQKSDDNSPLRLFLVIDAKDDGEFHGYSLGKQQTPDVVKNLQNSATMRVPLKTLKQEGHVKFNKKGNNDLLEFGFILSVREGDASPFFDPSCSDYGFLTKPKVPKKAQHYFVVSCRETSGYVDIKFYDPIDGSLKSKWSKQIKKVNHYEYKIPVELAVPEKPKRIGAVESRVSENKKIFMIYSRPYSQVKKFKFSAGAGPTYLAYSESPLGIDYSNIALTLKVSGLYTLSKKFDLAANIFGNTLSVGSTSDGSTARFYGINGRASYRLVKSRKIEIRGMAGWYLWGMLATGGSYGVSYLSGPQILFSFLFPRTLPHAFWVYLKFAPISRGFNLNLSNREIAGGMGYSLTKSNAKRGMAITLDIAHVNFQFPDALNRIRLFSASLGFQIDLTVNKY